MNANLFKAILAMDSYNRGYGESIKLPTILNSTKLGNATIVNQSDTDPSHDPVKASFYGIAYQMNSGEKIISYRGTDTPPNVDAAIINHDLSYIFTPDVWNGWFIGAGSIQSEQAKMAIKFYQSVVGGINNVYASNISLTGHSLGGGLAGYVAGAYNKTAITFDQMPYQYPLQKLKSYVLNPDDADKQKLLQDVYGTNFISNNPDLTTHRSYSIDGEALSSIRGSSVFGILTTSTIPNTPFSLGTDVTLLPLIPEDEDDARHSISTLIIRMYFSSQDLPTATPLWDSAAKYFWSEMYRDAFASSIGMNSILLSGTDRDKGEYSSILRQIIAYSAIDEGDNDTKSRPFGDTAIRAFYDDANDLGKAIVPLANANLVNSAKFISQAFVQYAGQLALSKILLSDNPTAKDGILSYYNDSRKYLDVSFNPDLWKKAAGGSLPNLVSQKNLFDGVLGLIDSSGTLSSHIQSTMASVWKTYGTVSDIEHFIFATKEGGTLYTSSLLSSELKANFFIGSNGADNIYGTEGQDIIYGGVGVDTMYGQNGNDIFISTAGNKTIYGGSGYDSISYAHYSGGITLVGRTVTKQDGIDTLYEMEKVTLTNSNDIVVMNSSDYRYLGNGDFVLDGGLGFDSFKTDAEGSYLMATKTILGIVKLENFDKFEIYTRMLLPDQNANITYVHGTGLVSGNTTITMPMTGNMFDYSTSTVGGIFRLHNHISSSTAAENMNVVTIAGNTHRYAVPDATMGYRGYEGVFRGTNKGDEVHIWAKQGSGAGGYGLNGTEPTMTFKSGTGDDKIYCESARGLELFYTGGHDIVYNALDVSRIILDIPVLFSNITVSYSPGSSVINMGSFGSLTLSGLRSDGLETPYIYLYSYNGTNFANNNVLSVQGDIWKRADYNESWASEIGKIQSGGVGDDTLIGNNLSNELYGGYGNDILNGGSGGDDKLYGQAGNDIYQYNLGNGRDIISDTEGLNEIILGPNISSSNILGFSRDYTTSSYTEITALLSDGGSITFNKEFRSFTFSDGTIYDLTRGITWIGTANSDDITGTIYNDVIKGGAGNDYIIGGSGNDTVLGEDGDDYLIGSSGNNRLEGGTGNDVYVYSPGEGGFDTILDSSGVDEINIGAGYLSTEMTTRVSGNDLIISWLSRDFILIQSQMSGSVVEKIRFSDGTILDLPAGSPAINGTSGNDNLVGTAANDTLNGYAGDDILNGGSGTDTLVGGLGNDTYLVENIGDIVTELSSEGTDIIQSSVTYTLSSNVENLTLTGALLINGTGNNLNNILTGNSGANTLNGGTGNDTLNGSTGVDTASYAGTASAVTVSLAVTAAQNTIGAGTDTLIGIENLLGSIYNDILTGDSNANLLDGSTGNDTINGGLGNDTLIGNNGIDTISYAGISSGVTVSLAITTGQNTIGAGTDTILSSENLIGTSFNDTLTGDGNANTIEGGLGNDTLNGGLGNDTLNGNTGVDTASYAGTASAVTVSLAITAAQNTIGAGTDTLIGIENLTGSSFNDILTGDALANIIDGGLGNDTLNGGAGNDTLNGNTGIDTASYAGTASAVTVSLALTAAQNTIGAGTDTLMGIENLTGSSFNDILTGDALANIIDGGLGNDTLNGGAGNDTLNGNTGIDTASYAGTASAVTVSLAVTAAQNTIGAGTDTLIGVENLLGSIYNDILTGDSNANLLDGSTGNDTINGGLGNDTLIGNNGIDTISYAGISSGVTVSLAITTGQNTIGAGTDTILSSENLIGSSFNDTLTGDSNANTIEGGLGNDTLNGGAGLDTVSYASSTAAVTVNLALTTAQNTIGAGTDTLSNFENIFASAFNDTLTGNSAANSINGGAGNDLIIGGLGADILTGGLGADTFRFLSTGLDASFDRISDFSTAQADKIDLKNLLVGYDPITKAITDFVEFTTSGANTVVKVDRDGTGTTYGWQQVAQLDNVTGLTDEAALRTSGHLIA